MLKSLMFSAALMLGQTEVASAPRAHLLPPADAGVVIGQPVVHKGPVAVLPVSAPSANLVTRPVTGALGGACDHHGGGCGASCGHDRCCDVTWLKPWKCEDLEMKPFECKPRCDSCGFLGRLLYCPEEENGNGACNGNGKEEKKEEKKNGDGNGNGNGEEAPDLNPLMQAIECRFPALFQRLECSGTKIYGWVNFGYTVNFDSPNDRLNMGVNFNNRSNDFTWNQIPYIVVEKTLDLDKKKDQWHTGYRVDFAYGHDPAHWANIGLGLFDHFTGSRLQSPRTHELGFDMPQFYADLHAPVLTDRGIDFRIGRFFTHQTFELSPAPSTYFYSHSYEYFYGMPFTHLGATATVHLGDTVDVMNGIVRGWDVVFQDTNDSYSWIGSYVWNSCDKRQNFAFTWTYGPEQLQNNHNDRTTLTAFYTRKFGCYNEWMWVGGGCTGFEQNVAQADGVHAAEWYALSTYLFYTVNPKLTLGTRFEWFRDDDGVRVTYFNDQALDATRPGSPGNYLDWTLGFTYKPYQNLRVRPELRFDWFDGAAGLVNPYNDRTDRFQTTLGMDVIWEF